MALSGISEALRGLAETSEDLDTGVVAGYVDFRKPTHDVCPLRLPAPLENLCNQRNAPFLSIAVSPFIP